MGTDWTDVVRGHENDSHIRSLENVASSTTFGKLVFSSQPKAAHSFAAPERATAEDDRSTKFRSEALRQQTSLEVQNQRGRGQVSR